MPSKKLLFVVEDDVDISRLIRHHLESAGFATRAFMSMPTVISEAQKDKPSLFLLDIMIPGGDGLELCRQIRELPALTAIPVIFLTAKSSEADRVLGLELGADDYISKPFSPREMVARVKAVLRRFERPLKPKVTQIDHIEINSGAMTLKIRGKTVNTTATEFRILDFMANNGGQVFTREQLLDAVWKDTSFVTPRSVDVYVRRLREKIEPDPDKPTYLRTVRGAGYKLETGK